MRKGRGVGNGVEPRKIPDEMNTSAIATSIEELLFICEQTSAILVSEECTWVIDSRASFHITPLREYFSTYIDGDHGYVKTGDNGDCKIVGVGSVFLTTSTRCRLTLKDVRHIPNIRLNLILIRRLHDEGYSGSFRNGKWKFCEGIFIVTRAHKEGTLYMMHARLCKSEVNVVANSNGEIWHKWLGHMSEKGLHMLADQKLLPEVKGVHL